jgi:hypothetical protein
MGDNSFIIIEVNKSINFWLKLRFIAIEIMAKISVEPNNIAKKI